MIKRYTFSKGEIFPRLGPFADGPLVISNAFQNPSNETLHDICVEIANEFREDEIRMKNFRSPKTLVCMIIPTKKFEFFKDYKKQGNFYQYELVKKYTLVTKVLWH